MENSLYFDDDAIYKWEFKNKGYIHFDSSYSKHRVDEVLQTLQKTGKPSHNFYPLIRFSIPKLKRDPKTNKRYEDKENPRYIMHTARTDSNIYSFYRNILMNKYHNLLVREKIQDSVIAYRRIPVKYGEKGNKCNIHFANEAIDEIISQTNLNESGCSAIAMDIKGFFDNLNHKIIRNQWCKVMGFEKGLTDEHWIIYKNITRYKYIDSQKIEKLLGIN